MDYKSEAIFSGTSKSQRMLLLSRKTHTSELFQMTKILIIKAFGNMNCRGSRHQYLKETLCDDCKNQSCSEFHHTVTVAENELKIKNDKAH